MTTQAKFLTGSTMRHVVTMTLTSAIGLSFMFLVDFLALWWVSRLGQEILLTALGFGTTIQFFVVSISIGMTIAAVALVSRALGQGRGQRARRIATAALVISVGSQVVISGATFVFRDALLRLAGAEGVALTIASDFLQLTLLSLPLATAGMCASAILRARGDAWRSMMVTMTAGLVAVVLDPVFIVLMDMGVEGAAIVILITRSAMSVVGLYWLIGTYRMLVRPRWMDIRLYLGRYLAIALPAIATQLSTPFGNWVLIRAMAEHGDSAVAGMGVVARLTILTFGGIFALSGAIGGIIGQNAGAGLHDRVRQAYLDALKFCLLYTLVVWAILAVVSGPVAHGFGLAPEGQEVVQLFSRYAVGAFVFTGALFVANSAFNNLGRPIWATIANWSRDGILIGPLAIALGGIYGAWGVLLGQAVANVLAGGVAAWVGWRLVQARAAPAPLDRAVTRP